MLIFIQFVKRLGNVERMVANALIIGQDFRIQDGSFHMTFPLSHALNLVGTVPGCPPVNVLFQKQSLFQKGVLLWPGFGLSDAGAANQAYGAHA